jgi:hypothetical protein
MCKRKVVTPSSSVPESPEDWWKMLQRPSSNRVDDSWWPDSVEGNRLPPSSHRPLHLKVVSLNIQKVGKEYLSQSAWVMDLLGVWIFTSILGTSGAKTNVRLR